MMNYNEKEPDRSKPCWALAQRGCYYGRVNLILREFEWKELAHVWRPTGNEHRETSLLRALDKADWIGVLPHQGRRRRTLTPETVKRVSTLFALGRGIKRVMSETGLSRGAITRIKALMEGSAKAGK